MVNITWDKDDLQNNRDNAGTTADTLGDHSGDLQQGYPLGSLTDGLVAYYPFDGDVNDHALSNDGTDNTSAGYVSGKVGSDAKDFDSSNNDYVEISNLTNIEKEATISCWVKVDSSINGSNNPNEVVIDGKNPGKSSRAFSIHLGNRDNDGGYEFLTLNSGTASLHSGVTTTGTWLHIAVTYDGSKKRIFLDGTQENSSSQSVDLSKFKAIDIGAATEEGKYTTEKIDDVRIYDRALSAPEIKALYHRTSTQTITDQDRLTAGLVGHHPLNEDNNGKAYDLSGQANDSTGTTGTTIKPGLGGTNARYFDGSDDEVSIYNSYRIFDDSKAWTVTYWTNPSSLTGSYPRHFTLGGERFVTGIINNNGNGNFQLRIHDGSNHYANITTSGTDTWYHVAYVHEAGGDYRAYKNGTLEDTINGSNVGTITSTSDDSKLGARRDGADNYNGKIQDFRIYNRALSQSEIKTLARLGGINTQ